MKVYGQLEKAQMENLGADPAAGVTGRLIFNTAEGRAKHDNGTVFRALLANDDKCVIGNNGTAANNVRLHRGAAGVLQFVPGNDVTAEGTLATGLAKLSFVFETYTTGARPAVGAAGRVIFNSSISSLQVDTGAVWSSIGGGGGSALIWRLVDNAPIEANVAGVNVCDFDYLSSQEIWAHIQVPESYAAGTQIKLKGGAFATSATAGAILFRATSYLLRAASTVLGTHSNSNTSTNAEVAAAPVASRITAIGDIELTDVSGQINAVAVAPGDVILVKLIRDTGNESASAPADARLLRDSFIPKFSA